MGQKLSFFSIRRILLPLRFENRKGKMKKILMMMAIAAGLTACNTNSNEAEKSPIGPNNLQLEGDRLTPEALWAMGRIGCAVPDVEVGGVAYTISYYSVPENRSTTWVRLAQKENDTLRTYDEFVGSDPAWWGNAQLTYLKGGKLYLTAGLSNEKELCLEGFDKPIEGYLLSPMRDKIILIAQVKTIETTAEKYPDLPLASGRVVDDLMYKHWDEWVETAPHPFLCDLHNDGTSLRVENVVDLLDGTAFECPMKPFGGVEQLAWSPDEKAIAYTCRKKTGLEYAISTNSDIYLYDLATGETRNLTEGMMGYDINPTFSPDGQWLAWESMERDGYESDKNRLFVQNLVTGERIDVSKDWDQSVASLVWDQNSQDIYLTSCQHGTTQIYRANIATRQFTQLTEGVHDYVALANNGTGLTALRQSMSAPTDIFEIDTKTGEQRQISFVNKPLLDQMAFGRVEERWMTTTDNKQMLVWVIYPPHFDASKKYPTLLYCEGGPQSPVSQFWSYRWNFQIMAANDYIIVAPNRRGLYGFGQEWLEQISGDYGGQCMKDYLIAIDTFCKEPFVDTDHLGCVGASFGGYSVYWLAGHHEKRFKAFIAHDGIFNMQQQYLETEEKWFANWDMGGAYWDKDNATAQRTFANSPHLFVDKWDAPILCIHGEKDYRILASQGMSAFDAAKMRGVPAELLIFPDENHWVLKPQNGILWQRTFFAWLDKWLKE
jgi:dipeptidyl aminopeptidase/acylaminoacyl peptidase